MLDETDAFQDERIARHIMAIHRDPKAAVTSAPFKPLVMQQYIRYVRSLKPRITEQVGAGGGRRRAGAGGGAVQRREGSCASPGAA
jgi:hypothetical protein